MEFLSGLFNSIQSWLLPGLEDEFGELTSKQEEFVRAVELINPLEFIDRYDWKGVGRKPSDRLCLLKAFIAKPIHRFTQTSMLIDAVNNSPVFRRLCGWESRNEIPSEATFSRAFSLFLKLNYRSEYMRQWYQKNIGRKLFGHKSTDSTSVKGRRKPAVKIQKR